MKGKGVWGGVRPLTASVVLLYPLWVAPGNNLTSESKSYLSSKSLCSWIPAAGHDAYPPLPSWFLLPGTHWAPEEQET